MAAGVAFDPAEFAAFKSGLAAPVQDAASTADAFDPAEFQAFKASQQKPTSFNDRFGSGPMASALDASTPEGSALRRAADEELIGKPSATNTATTALLGAGQGASLNLAGNAAAGVATGLGWLEGKGFPGVSGYGDGKRTFAENYARFQNLQGAYDRQNPKTAVASELAGGIAATPLMPGLPIAEGANLTARAARYGLTGAGYGGAAAAIGSHDSLKTIEGAGTGFAGGAALGPIVEKVAPPVIAAAGKALEPILARFGRGAVATETGFTPRARAVLINAGLDADNLPPELAQHIEASFAAKGETSAALREAQAAEFGLPLSRGQATADPRALAQEGRALAGQSGPRAQQIGEDFAARQADALAATRDRFMGMAAGDAPRVDSPQQAFEGAADRARQTAQAQAERESVAQRGVDDALRAVRGRGGPDAIDGATAAIQGVRDAAEQAKAGYRRAYADVGQYPGQFVPGAMDRVGSRVRVRLGSDVPIDDVLTPAATRALRDLDDVPGLFNLQPGEGPDLRQVEQLRKRLVAYRGTTTTNATDRRAMDQVIHQFDGHVEDAMGAGLFGQRQAAGSPALAGDGFPGFSAATAASGAVSAAGGPAAGKSEPLTHYLARNGGIALDGDARAADLGRVMTPYGPLGRKAGRPIEDFRDQLASEGFLRPDSADGMISRRIGDEVHDLIGQERAGQPVYRLSDLSRGGAPADAGGRLADQNAAYAERMAPFHRQVADDLAAVGVDARQAHPAHLEDAAGRLFRGEHDNGADAFEAAIMGRPTGEASRAPSSEIPFDSPTAAAASDALPGGDTAPLAAMQRARGLFRDYRQAFAPRFQGDAAGNNLRRILERDASPNEVASMLFGSPGSGRVTGGQVQTLGRIRSAVGPDSDAWQAVQGALINRHLGGEGRDLGARLDYLLSQDGRPLVDFLSGQQVAGLRALKGATRQLEAARQPMPDWITGLERTGFDPNAVGRSIFGGSGAIGAKPGAVLEATAARGLLGPNSAEWAGIRQAAVHRLLDPATPPAKMAAGLRDFTDGSGKGVASTLFNDRELAHFRRLSGVLQNTVRPDGSFKTDAAGEAGRKAAAKLVDLIAGAVAFKVGGLGAAAGTYSAKVGTRAIIGGLGAASARRSFEGGAPRLLAPPPGYAVSAGSSTGRVLAPLGTGY
ncbi:hypothetical protein MKK75_00255 [Methylobacterium sp. J-030]|uniref:hypothetical protein n=1 Tax=Methylobacterium sp. J-030 TaxID=2836627 RepID=UPI001FBB9B22|nr:hypothetical protein [Methylobacterium sp. J-030]MCJ2067253.1 hypothetical protein [Methylobacterium sp. J-030]